MRRLRAFGAGVIGVAAVAIMLSAGTAAADAGVRPAAACSWRLDTRLPLPAGFTSGVVNATDGATRFAGTVQNVTVSDTLRAVVWQGGRVSLLPTPVGLSSYAFGLNRAGDVVGAVIGASGPGKPVLWRGGRLIELRTISPDTHANARDINDAGLIVGEALDPGNDNRAVAWTADVPDKISYVSAPGTPSLLTAVTEDGVLAGHVGEDLGTRFRSLGVAGTLAAGLHTLPETVIGASTNVYAAAGAYLAGSLTAAGDIESHATIWRNETATIVSKRDSVAWGVNSQGIAAGYDWAAGRPLVWVNGVEQELPLITIGPSVTSANAQVVTEDGAVAGWVNESTGNSRPVLWHCR